jgi:hypothetical protein
LSSREVEGIIGYLARQGVPFRVTSTTGGDHSTNSYHHRAGTGGDGLAVDFAEPQPSFNSPGLAAIFAAFRPVERQLAELIYSGGSYSIKHGARVNRYAIKTHWDHVHVAVPRGVFLAPTPFPEVTVPDDPTAPNLFDIKFFVPVVFNGVCTGYYMASSKGEVHGHGPGAPYHGRSEVL